MGLRNINRLVRQAERIERHEAANPLRPQDMPNTQLTIGLIVAGLVMWFVANALGGLWAVLLPFGVILAISGWLKVMYDALTARRYGKAAGWAFASMFLFFAAIVKFL